MSGTLVKPVSPVYRILVMSIAETDGADVVQAWDIANSLKQHGSCQVIHLGCELSHDALVILDIMDRNRDGFIEAAVLTPPASSWSRARHIQDGTQNPVRSRSHPAGLPALSAVNLCKVVAANRYVEIAAWIAEQALSCVSQKVAVMFIFPENSAATHELAQRRLGLLQNLRQLESFTDVKRTFFYCAVSQARPKDVHSLCLPTQRYLTLWGIKAGQSSIFSTTTLSTMVHCQKHVPAQRNISNL